MHSEAEVKIMKLPRCMPSLWNDSEIDQKAGQDKNKTEPNERARGCLVFLRVHTQRRVRRGRGDGARKLKNYKTSEDFPQKKVP